MMRVGVLISGRGSNLQSLIDAWQGGSLPIDMVSVLSNVAGVQGLERARAAGIPANVVEHNNFDGRESFEGALDEALSKAGVDFLCLAGFMRLLTDGFVNQWQDRLINIHPSLLPAFKGLDTHARAIEAGVRFAGCTVHFVRPAMDDGPIIVQAALSFSTAILDAAALGVLGMGAQPPTPEWGTMLADAREFVLRAWWVVPCPGIAILVTVLAINLMGDGLRDALDPKLKRS